MCSETVVPDAKDRRESGRGCGRGGHCGRGWGDSRAVRQRVRRRGRGANGGRGLVGGAPSPRSGASRSRKAPGARERERRPGPLADAHFGRGPPSPPRWHAQLYARSSRPSCSWETYLSRVSPLRSASTPPERSGSRHPPRTQATALSPRRRSVNRLPAPTPPLKAPPWTRLREPAPPSTPTPLSGE